MLQRGYLRQDKKGENLNKGNSGAGNLIMYGGILIILASLIFMIINLSVADKVIIIWLPFMIAGVVLVFTSVIVKMNSYRPRR